ncbi:MAG TPA: hypothetical protein PKD53_03865 [Chloroflexaceae bacterium]|nr:hypothetical protein [Chloroflexaceae bacterium]
MSIVEETSVAPVGADPVVVGRWWLGLALGAVVIGAVAALLETLLRSVRRIERGAAEVWRVGKLIANNTVHVPLLVRTNQVVDEIGAATGGIAQAATRIERAVAPPDGKEP